MTKFTLKEIHTVRRLLRKTGAAVAYNEIDWYWRGGLVNRLMERFGVMAMYLAVRDAVCIPEYMRDAFQAGFLTSVLVHELVHAKQRRDMGFFKYMLTKTFMRAKLEREAESEEQRVEALLGQAFGAYKKES